MPQAALIQVYDIDFNLSNIFANILFGLLGPVYIVPIYNTTLLLACQLIFLIIFILFSLFFLLYISAILYKHNFPIFFCLFLIFDLTRFFALKKQVILTYFFFLLSIQYFSFSLSIFSSFTVSFFIISSINIFLISVFFSGYDIHSSVFISNR